MHGDAAQVDGGMNGSSNRPHSGSAAYKQHGENHAPSDAPPIAAAAAMTDAGDDMGGPSETHSSGHAKSDAKKERLMPTNKRTVIMSKHAVKEL